MIKHFYEIFRTTQKRAPCIDRIDDMETLWAMHEEVVEYLRKDVGEEEGLSEEQELQLQEAIRQADAGEFVSEKEYLKSTARWVQNKED